MAKKEPPKTPATYADLEQVPEFFVAEILDGELYSTPRPAPRHAKAGSAIIGALYGPFNIGRGGPGGWQILYEPELHFGNDVIVPDVAGWRRERLPSLPAIAFFTMAPDWVCEVVSPSTASIDRVTKLAIYARAGVHHAWLVDPIARTLEVLRLEGGRWSIVSTDGEAEIVRPEPFDALEFDLSLLWE